MSVADFDKFMQSHSLENYKHGGVSKVWNKDHTASHPVYHIIGNAATKVVAVNPDPTATILMNLASPCVIAEGKVVNTTLANAHTLYGCENHGSVNIGTASSMQIMI